MSEGQQDRILMDAEANGSLIDDRFKNAGFEEVLLQVQALKAGWVADRAARAVDSVGTTAG